MFHQQIRGMSHQIAHTGGILQGLNGYGYQTRSHYHSHTSRQMSFGGPQSPTGDNLSDVPCFGTH